MSFVRSAIVRLADCMRTDDPPARSKAAEALMDLGPCAAGPLAVSIARTTDVAHRMSVLALLRAIGTLADPDVAQVLMPMVKEEPVELLARMAAKIFLHLSEREFPAAIQAGSEAARRTADAATGATAG